MEQPADLAMRLKPEAEAIPDLLDRLEAYAEEAGLAPAIAHRLALVCEELVANVAMHGIGATYVTVALHAEAGALRLEIEDDGPAFDPLAAEEPDTALAVEDREVGGLGIHFVRNLVHDLAYRREAGRNRLTALLAAG